MGLVRAKTAVGTRELLFMGNVVVRGNCIVDVGPKGSSVVFVYKVLLRLLLSAFLLMHSFDLFVCTFVRESY